MKKKWSEPLLPFDEYQGDNSKIVALIELANAVTLELDQKAERLAKLRNLIHAQMQEAGLTRLETPGRVEAVRYKQTHYKWNPKKLLTEVPKELLDSLLPRCPQTKKLRKLMESHDPLRSKLRKCAVRTSGWQLAIRPVKAKESKKEAA